ncbi:MAG: extracellular solute-binding protein [Syntrophomonadaceae bacterium]|jgi:molybdate/tungstate transport system substrate-binding protein
MTSGALSPDNGIIAFTAGSLKPALQEIARVFSKSHRPGVDVYFEASGSLDCVRKATEQGRKVDLIAIADYSIFEQFIIPRYSDWYAMFATNRMVLCYTKTSRLYKEINSDNWYRLLLNKGVSYAHTNPNLDPAGYRTLMVWQLAAKHYKQPGLDKAFSQSCAREWVYDRASDLIEALKNGLIDYAFEYASVAQQNNLEYIELPVEINLSNPQYTELYQSARVNTSGPQGSIIQQIGKPIVYALTVINNAPHKDLAIEFVRFILGTVGQSIIESAGLQSIIPARFKNPAMTPTSFLQNLS